MKYFTVTEQRNRRLCREVEKEWSARRGATPAEVIDSVIDRPLRRGFYIGVDSAIVMERKYRRGRAALPAGKRGRVWADFLSQLKELRAREPTLTRVEAICRTLACGTSNRGFALSRDSALKIINNWQKNNHPQQTFQQ